MAALRANEMFNEGERMHHCVTTYQEKCITGSSSIWSLRCEYPRSQFKDCLTIELSHSGTIVQCRGFANRQPTNDELAVVDRWAADHKLIWQHL